MKTVVVYIQIVFFTSFGLLAQNFNAKEQYNQAMKNAKLAFDAKQYSEAVMFYREALNIMPEALLPKYKIEDIRTIYLEKEISAQLEQPKPIEQKPVIAENKAVNPVDSQTKQLAEQEAMRKMYADADRVEAELRTANVAVIDISNSPEDLDVGNAVLVPELEKNKETGLNKIDTKTTTALHTPKVENSNAQIVVENRKAPEPVVIEKEVIAPKQETVKPVEKPVVVNTVSVASSGLTAAEKQDWIKKEQERLIQVYPNLKTIEELEKPGKHITRVIMNIDNKVTVYLKVCHSWGATYFFIDEVGQELKSISESYFNLMTNLKTYGG